MKGSWFKYILYLSVIFLIIALIRSDYLVVPVVHSPIFLVFSFLMLFGGFLFMSLYWKILLQLGDVQTSISRSISSIGLSIFAKYIPGKVWVILGRAAYIAEHNNVSKATTSSLSLQAQLISLWTGLLLGGIGLLSIGTAEQINYGLSLAALWLAFSLIIFTPYFNRLLKKILMAVFKREINIPVISIGKIGRVIPYFFLNWLAWSCAFYFLSQSLVTDPISPISGFGFAFAGTLGILAIIVPGGLGVREGFLAWYLILMGLDKPTAVTISVSSRLWFLIGEIFIFSLGMFFHRKTQSSVKTSE